MGTSDLPEIYTQALGRSPSVSAYISGISQVPMLQLIYSTWASVGKLQECFASVFIWDHVNFDCG